MALGARVNETPLKEPKEHIVDGLKTLLRIPNSRRQRSIGAVQLPFGAVPGINPLCMDVNDPYTFACGYKQRLFRVVPKPDKAELAKLSVFVDKWCCANIHPVEPLEFETWLESTGYNCHRKDQLRSEYMDLRGGIPSERQCEHVDTHGKHESYPEYKHMRVINSRSDAFKAYSGPYFKAIEEELYKHKYFVKHMTPAQRMERVKEMNNIGGFCYATDYTAFESHFTDDVMEALELRLYRHCLVSHPQAATVLCNTISGVNRMRTRWGFKANCIARRMSGDMCTSLGNGFSNLMLVKYIVESKGGVFDGIVEGDDALFVSTVPVCADDWKKLGFTIKIEQVTDPRRASFCGLVFGASGQVIRDPRRFLQTFGWSEDYICSSPRVHWELLRAKALSALAETPDCPVVGVVARKAYQMSEGYQARFTDRWKAAHTPDWVEKPFAPTPETRLLFQDMYGISPDQQRFLERCIMAGDMTPISSIVVPHNHVADYAGRFLETWEIESNRRVLPTKYSTPSGLG